MLKSLTLQQEVYRRDAVYKTPDWSFDTEIGRYRDLNTGRFLSQADALKLTQRSVTFAATKADQLTQSLINGTVSISEWQRQFAGLVKQLHLGQYILGRGGIKNTYPADFLVVARTLREEYRYLDQFASDIATGQFSEKQIKARARLYMNKGVTSYWMGDREAQSRTQTTPQEMRRILGAAEHCPDCLAYAGTGWAPVGALPMPCQNCECGANCKCSVEYRGSVPVGSFLVP